MLSRPTYFCFCCPGFTTNGSIARKGHPKADLFTEFLRRPSVFLPIWQKSKSYLGSPRMDVVECLKDNWPK